MEKIWQRLKNFINKYKSEILIILGGISGIFASFYGLETDNAIVCSIVIAIIGVIVEILKNGMTEKAIELLAKTIKIIIDAINDDKDSDEEKVVSTPKRLTEEDIINILKN